MLMMSHLSMYGRSKNGELTKYTSALIDQRLLDMAEGIFSELDCRHYLQLKAALFSLNIYTLN